MTYIILSAILGAGFGLSLWAYAICKVGGAMDRRVNRELPEMRGRVDLEV